MTRTPAAIITTIITAIEGIITGMTMRMKDVLIITMGIIIAMNIDVSVVFPSFVIILLIMVLLKKGDEEPLCAGDSSRGKPCIIGNIFATGVYMVLRMGEL